LVDLATPATPGPLAPWPLASPGLPWQPPDPLASPGLPWQPTSANLWLSGRFSHNFAELDRGDGR